MKNLLPVVILFLLPGCVVQPPASTADTTHLLDGSLLGITLQDPIEENIFALTPEMRFWVRNKIRHATSDRSKLQRLVQGLIDDGLLNLEYDQNLTRPAAETFEQRRGNCLSFSILFVSLAREAGLNATFQMVEIPPSFSSSGELVMLNNHINVLVTRIRASTSFHQNHVVDFNTAEYSGNYQTRRVSDNYAIALYHSNVAVEQLQQGNWEVAFLHLRKALMADARVPGIWTNLGVIYSSRRFPAEAIAAYQQALQINPAFKSALVNLIAAYEAQDDFEQAAHYRDRARYYRNRNPYYHHQQASSAFGQADYTAALNSIESAIQLKPDEHQFFFLKGLAQLRLGWHAQAVTSLRQASRLAQREDVAARYLQKIEHLEQTGSLLQSTNQ